jgi:hypothetical protein
LEGLFKRATQNKEYVVRKAVAKTLVKHGEAFSKNDDDDLGRTSLVEHAINTGDSRPL